MHNYFQKDKYEDAFEQIWKKLKDKKLVKNNLKTIINLTYLNTLHISHYTRSTRFSN